VCVIMARYAHILRLYIINWLSMLACNRFSVAVWFLSRTKQNPMMGTKLGERLYQNDNLT